MQDFKVPNQHVCLRGGKKDLQIHLRQILKLQFLLGHL